MARRQGLHGADLFLHAIGAVPVALVHDEDVGDLHDAGFDGLHIITHAGDEDDHGDVRQADDVHLILAHADGLHHDALAAAGVKHGGGIGRSARQSAEKTAGRHAAHEDARIGMVRCHADAVTENGAARIWTGWIHCQYANRSSLAAVVTGELVYQRALASARRPCETDDARLAA